MTVLLFIAMITLFLGIDFVVQRKKRVLALEQPARRAPLPLRIPEGIFFAPSHTWLSLSPAGNVRLGVDDFILRMMENPEVIFLKNPGTHAAKGDPLLQLKEGSRSLTVRSPIDADIVAANEELCHHPGLLKEMLFSHGWAYAVKPRRISDLTQMLLGETTRGWIQRELGRLRDFVIASSHGATPVPALLQDGGIPVEGTFKNFSAETCEEFEKQFLLVH